MGVGCRYEFGFGFLINSKLDGYWWLAFVVGGGCSDEMMIMLLVIVVMNFWIFYGFFMKFDEGDVEEEGRI